MRLKTFSYLTLLIFLVPGSINLSKVTGLTGLKSTIGIDLNGIRLILFCLVSGFFVIINKKIGKAFKVYLFFLYYCFLTLLYTSDTLEGIRLFSKLLVPLLIYSLAVSLPYLTLEKINKAFYFVLLLHFSFILPNWIEWFEPYSGIGDIVRASGLTGGRVIFGTFMLFMFILFYSRSLLSRKSLLPIFISLIGVVLSGARIAWLGLLIFVLLSGEFKKKRNIILALIFVLCVVFPLRHLLIQRVGIGYSEGKIVFYEPGFGTVQHRIQVWKWLIEEKIPHRFFLGYGLGSSQKILSEAPLPPMDYPHNEYLRLWLEAGIVGVILFCFAYFFMTIYFYKKQKSLLLVLPILVYIFLGIAENTLNNYFENGGVLAYSLVYLKKSLAEKQNGSP